MSHIFTLKRNDPRIDQLILFLKDRGWLSRKQIADALRWSIRDVSAVVQASEGEILATQKGFKLTIQSTHEEWQESDNSLGGQITNNTLRRANQSKIFHGGTNAPS